MTTRETSAPFDEAALRALFDAIEAPAAMQARWQARVVLGTGEAPAELPAVRAIPDLAEPVAPRRSTARMMVAAVAALAMGGGIAGVIAADQRPAPDPDQIVVTIEDPTTTSVPPSPTSPPAPVSAGPGAPPGAQPGTPGGPGGPVDTPPRPGPTPGGPASPATQIAPARGPLTVWPNTGNTGVPPETRLQVHEGDLHITEPGAIIANLRVTGTLYVDAPDVTLRRVRVAPQSGDTGVWQRAPRLRIEDSEVEGQLRHGVRQEAPGLVVQRSDIAVYPTSVWVTSDATIVDSNLNGVRTTGNASRITVRHSTIGAAISLLDENGPVTEVMIDNNQLESIIYAPSDPASHHLVVTGNRFIRWQSNNPRIAASGWNAQAPGNIWTGNVWSDTSEPANP